MQVRPATSTSCRRTRTWRSWAGVCASWSRRRRAAGACPSTPSSARWRRTAASGPSASSSPAPAATARSGCAPSRARAAWPWRRPRDAPPTTACRAAPSPPAWSTTCCRPARCPSSSSATRTAPSRVAPAARRRPRTTERLTRDPRPAARPHRARLLARTSAPPSGAASSAAWPSPRSSAWTTTSRSCSGDAARGRDPVPRAAHRRHQLLPRPRGLRGAGDEGRRPELVAAQAARRPGARLGARLLHRRGGLLASPSSCRSSAEDVKRHVPRPDLRHRHRRRRPSSGRAPASTRRASPPTSRPSAWRASSRRRATATASRKTMRDMRRLRRAGRDQGPAVLARST